MKPFERPSSAVQYYGTRAIIRLIRALPHETALVQGAYIVKIDGVSHLRIEKAVDALDFEEGDETVQRLSDFIPSFEAPEVERYPDQWFWLHSRRGRRSNFALTIRNEHDFKEMVVAGAERIRAQRRQS